VERWASVVPGKAKQTDRDVDFIPPHAAQCTSLPCLALTACGGTPIIQTDVGIGFGFDRTQ